MNRVASLVNDCRGPLTGLLVAACILGTVGGPRTLLGGAATLVGAVSLLWLGCRLLDAWAGTRWGPLPPRRVRLRLHGVRLTVMGAGGGAAAWALDEGAAQIAIAAQVLVVLAFPATVRTLHWARRVLQGVIRAGDWVVLGPVEGIVEDLDSRCVRIRTFPDGEVSVPFDAPAGGAFRNFRDRRFRRYRKTWECREGTEADCARRVLDALAVGQGVRPDLCETRPSGPGRIQVKAFVVAPDLGVDLQVRVRVDRTVANVLAAGRQDGTG